jgi:hypothetical protein
MKSNSSGHDGHCGEEESVWTENSRGASTRNGDEDSYYTHYSEGSMGLAKRQNKKLSLVTYIPLGGEDDGTVCDEETETAANEHDSSGRGSSSSRKSSVILPVRQPPPAPQKGENSNSTHRTRGSGSRAWRRDLSVMTEEDMSVMTEERDESPRFDAVMQQRLGHTTQNPSQPQRSPPKQLPISSPLSPNSNSHIGGPTSVASPLSPALLASDGAESRSRRRNRLAKMAAASGESDSEFSRTPSPKKKSNKPPTRGRGEAFFQKTNKIKNIATTTTTESRQDVAEVEVDQHGSKLHKRYSNKYSSPKANRRADRDASQEEAFSTPEHDEKAIAESKEDPSDVGSRSRIRNRYANFAKAIHRPEGSSSKDRETTSQERPSSRYRETEEETGSSASREMLTSSHNKQRKSSWKGGDGDILGLSSNDSSTVGTYGTRDYTVGTYEDSILPVDNPRSLTPVVEELLAGSSDSTVGANHQFAPCGPRFVQNTRFIRGADGGSCTSYTTQCTSFVTKVWSSCGAMHGYQTESTNTYMQFEMIAEQSVSTIFKSGKQGNRELPDAFQHARALAAHQERNQYKLDFDDSSVLSPAEVDDNGSILSYGEVQYNRTDEAAYDDGTHTGFGLNVNGALNALSTEFRNFAQSTKAGTNAFAKVMNSGFHGNDAKNNTVANDANNLFDSMQKFYEPHHRPYANDSPSGAFSHYGDDDDVLANPSVKSMDDQSEASTHVFDLPPSPINGPTSPTSTELNTQPPTSPTSIYSSVVKSTNRREMMMDLQRRRMKGGTKPEPEPETTRNLAAALRRKSAEETAHLRRLYLSLRDKIHEDEEPSANQESSPSEGLARDGDSKERSSLQDTSEDASANAPAAFFKPDGRDDSFSENQVRSAVEEERDYAVVWAASEYSTDPSPRAADGDREIPMMRSEREQAAEGNADAPSSNPGILEDEPMQADPDPTEDTHSYQPNMDVNNLLDGEETVDETVATKYLDTREAPSTSSSTEEVADVTDNAQSNDSALMADPTPPSRDSPETITQKSTTNSEEIDDLLNSFLDSSRSRNTEESADEFHSIKESSSSEQLPPDDATASLSGVDEDDAAEIICQEFPQQSIPEEPLRTRSQNFEDIYALEFPQQQSIPEQPLGPRSQNFHDICSPDREEEGEEPKVESVDEGDSFSTEFEDTQELASVRSADRTVAESVVSHSLRSNDLSLADSIISQTTRSNDRPLPESIISHSLQEEEHAHAFDQPRFVDEPESFVDEVLDLDHEVSDYQVLYQISEEDEEVSDENSEDYALLEEDDYALLEEDGSFEQQNDLPFAQDVSLDEYQQASSYKAKSSSIISSLTKILVTVLVAGYFGFFGTGLESYLAQISSGVPMKSVIDVAHRGPHHLSRSRSFDPPTTLSHIPHLDGHRVEGEESTKEEEEKPVVVFEEELSLEEEAPSEEEPVIEAVEEKDSNIPHADGNGVEGEESTIEEPVIEAVEEQVKNEEEPVVVFEEEPTSMEEEPAVVFEGEPYLEEEAAPVEEDEEPVIEAKEEQVKEREEEPVVIEPASMKEEPVVVFEEEPSLEEEAAPIEEEEPFIEALEEQVKETEAEEAEKPDVVVEEEPASTEEALAPVEEKEEEPAVEAVLYYFEGLIPVEEDGVVEDHTENISMRAVKEDELPLFDGISVMDKDSCVSKPFAVGETRFFDATELSEESGEAYYRLKWKKELKEALMKA